MEIATAVGGAVLGPVFQYFSNQLTSQELLKFARKKNVLTELNKWKEILKRIDGVLEDAEDKQAMDRSVKIWMSQLRDLAYDVEDILDEFDFEVRRSKLKAERVGRRVFKVRKILAKMNLKAIKSNIQMISKIKAVTARFEDIASQQTKLALREVATGRKGSTSTEERATSCLVNTTDIYGREEDKKAILQLLYSELNGGKFSVIAIVGLGGVGKTTLAKLIFDAAVNFYEAEKKFDLSGWISVGEDFNVVRLTKSLLRSVGGDFEENDDFNHLQVCLKEKLSGKKFLIVLDDCWSENYEAWTTFRHPLEYGAKTSRIVVTTRSLDISQMMSAVHSYLLNELTSNESLCLLAQHAFEKPNFNGFEDLEDLGKRIVERCGCLPLAVKALRGLLKKEKLTRSAWENVLMSGIWKESSPILPSLRLSYHYLAPHLKRCFAYCAIFPKDYEFNPEKVVKLWMAEGFLQPSSHCSQNRMQLGYGYFEDLLSRSFFQESITYRSIYVMHHLVNDLSHSINEEICLNLNEMSIASISHAKVRHLAYTSPLFNSYQRFEGLDKMSSLRTFLALNYQLDKAAYEAVHKLVPKCKRLRVLSLFCYYSDKLPSSIGALKHLRDLDLSYASSIRKLPESLGNLINLETLNLRGCEGLKKLPAGIGNLINLETLNLHDCSDLLELPAGVGSLINLETLNLKGCRDLIELPAGIGNLIKLVHLDLEDTFSLYELPREVTNLRKLQTLSQFIVGKGNNVLGIRDLMNFPLLAGKLFIRGLENVTTIPDANLADLCKFEGLDGLALVWSYSYLDDSQRKEEHEFQVLNSLKAHKNLEKLFVSFYGGKIFPSWIGDPTFTNMVDLELRNCPNIISVPSFGGLPKLKWLCIEGMRKVVEVGVEFYGENSSSIELFPSLETLEIEDMPMWKQWSHPVGKLNEGVATIFPRLHKLTIRKCPELVVTLPTSLSSLEVLRILGCQNIITGEGLPPNLSKLHISRCQNLQQPVSEWKLNRLTSLTELKIRGKCESTNMGSFPDKECLWLPSSLTDLTIGGFENLKSISSGINCLTSLQRLEIGNCAKLEFLPREGLPSTLGYLEIRNCPLLEKRCRENGEYWQLIANIPDLKIK